MKLKTLKDFGDIECYVKFEPIPINDSVIELNSLRFISEKRLRDEAIKWIKKLKKEQKNFFKTNILHIDIEQYNEINFGNTKKIEWIKHFFNITSKDLEDD